MNPGILGGVFLNVALGRGEGQRLDVESDETRTWWVVLQGLHTASGNTPALNLFSSKYSCFLQIEVFPREGTWWGERSVKLTRKS